MLKEIEKSMDVLIITNYDFRVPKRNGRFKYLGEILKEEHKIEAVTSDFSHADKKHLDRNGKNWPYKVTYLHEPGYQKNVCLKRFLSHFIWGKNIKEYLRTRKKPDIVYCAVPSLTGAFIAAKYCEKNSVRFVIDVQDLWPEAFQMVFHIPVISKLLFAPFKILANGIYKRADEICAVSQTYVDRALSVNKKCASGHCVFLGTELKTFDKNAKNNSSFDEWKIKSGAALKKQAGELWLGYCGTLGHSYDITCVIDALAIIADEKDIHLRFIVMGDGPRRKEFEEYAEKKKANVCFTGRLPYDRMCGLLSACDIAVNPITQGAAQSIINKHADYAAAGIPVINTQECEEYRKLVEQYHMGFNCVNNDADDLAEKIRVLVNDEKLREEMGQNARRCAEEKFDRERTYKKINLLINKK